MTVAAPSRFFFEDVVLHGVVETPAITVTRAHVALYAGVTGDGEADSAVAPDLLLLGLTTGLGWRVPQPPLAVLAFMGVEWHVDAPVRIGDTIHSRSRTAVKRARREGGVIVEERQVGASLGADSIRKGVLAGLVGTALVILIMVGYYRMAGVLSIVALAIYLLFTLGGLSMLEATLTLPGLAGIVLSIGIAVDANVLIFERIREELVHGKTVRLAVDEGFKHAMNAIIDSNVCAVLTALFLF